MDKQMLEALWIVIYSATKCAVKGAASYREVHLPQDTTDNPDLLGNEMNRAVELACQKLGKR